MYICMYVRWLSTCSDMFQLENEIFVNGLAFRKRFHGNGNVSCLRKDGNYGRVDALNVIRFSSVETCSRLVSIDCAPLPDRISRFRLPLKGGFTASGKI